MGSNPTPGAIKTIEVEPNLVSTVDFTAIVSAAAGLLLAVFAVVQLRHMEQHRNVDISMKLFEWAENDRLRRAFRMG